MKRHKKFPNKQKCAAHFKDWAKNGREMVVNGKTVRLYTIGKLMDAFASIGIPRSYDCFRRWIREGDMPDTPIRISHRAWYTQGMIECLAMTALEAGMTKITPNMKFMKQRWYEEFDKVVRKDLM